MERNTGNNPGFVIDKHFKDILANLLDSANITSNDFTLEPCETGGNNRVYIIDASGKKLIAKQYYFSSDDQRDRLDSEWCFLNYTKAVGIDCVPQAFGFDASNRIALYEFIEGRKLDVSEIGLREVEAAIEFTWQLNNQRNKKELPSIPVASEACFTINEHIKLVEKRIKQLGVTDSEYNFDKKVQIFLNIINDYWDRLKNSILESASAIGIESHHVLTEDNRCISPSDFGFHNAIKRPDGKIIFIDFEYAGWDDPAKMIADFFYHPAVPIAFDYHQLFRKRVLATLDNKSILALRTDMLRPLFGLKWCCIMLNVFIPEGIMRKKFADTSLDINDLRHQRFCSAQKLFKTLPKISNCTVGI